MTQAVAQHAFFYITPLTHTTGPSSPSPWECGVVTPLERPITGHPLARDLSGVRVQLLSEGTVLTVYYLWLIDWSRDSKKRQTVPYRLKRGLQSNPT